MNRRGGQTGSTGEPERWQARPHLARLVRSVAMLAPMVASTVAVFGFSRLVSRPAGWAQILWWAAALAFGTAVLVGVDRVARKLLPLAALLRLSLVFPDAAPPRFGLALRRGSLRHLQREPGALGTTPAEAAAEMARLVAELQAHDRSTRGHAERVRAYSVLLGEEMGLNQHDADRLQWAALLHDIGKLSVPTSILNKPGRLNDDEFALIKNHPAEGDRMVAPLNWWLGTWTGAVGQHHERWDGKGYPYGLTGTDITLAGRIVAVADTFDVMTAARSYKRPQDPAVARAELTRCAGTQFDPDVVRAFLNVSLGGLRRIMGPLSWLTNVPILGSVTTAAGAPIATVTTTLATVSTATALGVASAALMPVALSTAARNEQGRHVSGQLISATDFLARIDSAPEGSGEDHSPPGTGLTLGVPDPATTSPLSPTTTTTTTLDVVVVTTTGPVATTMPTTTVPPTTVPATPTTNPTTTTTLPTTVIPTTSIVITGPPPPVTITPPLTAVDDSYASSSSLNTMNLAVLDNDSGTGVLQVVRLEKLSATGTGSYELLVNPTQRVRFSPIGAYFGQARFRYTVRDLLGNEATAVVIVLTPPAG